MKIDKKCTKLGRNRYTKKGRKQTENRQSMDKKKTKKENEQKAKNYENKDRQEQIKIVHVSSGSNHIIYLP